MKPRNPLVQFAFLAAVTGLPFGVFMSVWMGFFLSLVARPSLSWLATNMAVSGLMFGVLFSALMTPLFRDTELVVPVQDRQAFDASLGKALVKIGYKPAFLGDSYVEVHPGFKAGFLAGSIRLSFSQSQVRILGPWMHVRKVRACLQRDSSPC